MRIRAEKGHPEEKDAGCVIVLAYASEKAQGKRYGERHRSSIRVVDGKALSAMIELYYRRLGARVRAARKAARLTQGEVGQLLDPPVTRASVANIELGKQRVLSHTLVQLAVAVRCPVLHLIGGFSK